MSINVGPKYKKKHGDYITTEVDQPKTSYLVTSIHYRAFFGSKSIHINYRHKALVYAYFIQLF